MNVGMSFASMLMAGALVSAGSAAIVVENTTGGMYDTSSGIGSISYSLTGVGNALVFGTYLDAGWTGSGLQFGGVDADGVIQNDRVLLAYFLDPVSSGDLTINTAAAAANSAYFIYELGNVDTSVAVDIGIGGSLTTTVDGRFVVNFLGLNNDPGTSIAPAAGSIASLDGVGDSNGAIGGGSVPAGSGLAGAAGSQTLGWDGFGGGFPQGEVSAGFSAIPEPSSMMLGGLGLLGVLRRRR